MHLSISHVLITLFFPFHKILPLLSTLHPLEHLNNNSPFSQVCILPLTMLTCPLHPAHVILSEALSLFPSSQSLFLPTVTKSSYPCFFSASPSSCTYFTIADPAGPLSLYFFLFSFSLFLHSSITGSCTPFSFISFTPFNDFPLQTVLIPQQYNFNAFSNYIYIYITLHRSDNTWLTAHTYSQHLRIPVCSRVQCTHSSKKNSSLFALGSTVKTAIHSSLFTEIRLALYSLPSPCSSISLVPVI